MISRFTFSFATFALCLFITNFQAKTLDLKNDSLKQKGSYQLIWSDEFNKDGALDSKKWTYDLGRGQDGWGNKEEQFYTNRPENVRIKKGVLEITAKREDFQQAKYTSARIKAEGLFDFKYGKVEIRAKLPLGKGVWPAMWFLGSNIKKVGWPKSGEIDMMEFIGREPESLMSNIHTPAGFGAHAVGGKTKITKPNDWHLYKMEWDADAIRFYLDNQLYYTYKPLDKTKESWPFDQKFFMIMNVAMGGGLGGTIDSGFKSTTFYIDYVRIYQKK